MTYLIPKPNNYMINMLYAYAVGIVVMFVCVGKIAYKTHKAKQEAKKVKEQEKLV